MERVSRSNMRVEFFKKNSIIGDIFKNRQIYLILLPGIIFYLVFCYTPMYGILLAFQEYVPGSTVLGSPFNGIANFQKIFENSEFWNAFRNTVVISICRIAFEFPVPIIIAIMINELNNGKFRKIIQTLYTLPHFLSWVIVSGVIINFFAVGGPVNQIITLLGGNEKAFMADGNLFFWMVFISNIWKEAGWSTIIYLAAISSIDMEQYEAAEIDGANRLRRMIHITWPGVRPTCIVLLILALGNVMNGGFDQIFNIYNPVVQQNVDIIDTYIYRITFLASGDFGFSTAVGLFKSVINFVLLVGANQIVKKFNENGLF